MDPRDPRHPDHPAYRGGDGGPPRGGRDPRQDGGGGKGNRPPKESNPTHEGRRKVKGKTNWLAEILLVVPEGFCKVYRTDYVTPKTKYKERVFWTLVQVPILLISLEGLYLTTMNVPQIAESVYREGVNEVTLTEDVLLNRELRFLPKPWGDDGAQLRRLAPNGQLKDLLGSFRDLNFATDLMGAAIDSLPIVNTLTRVDPEYEGQTIYDNWDKFLIAMIASVAIQRVQGMFVRKMSRDVLARRVASYNAASKVEAKDDAIWAAKPAAVTHNSYGIGEFIIPMMVVVLAYSVEIGTSLAMVRGLGLSSMGKLILILGNCLGFEISERIREIEKDFNP